jgi:hypothetical protein
MLTETCTYPKRLERPGHRHLWGLRDSRACGHAKHQFAERLKTIRNVYARTEGSVVKNSARPPIKQDVLQKAFVHDQCHKMCEARFPVCSATNQPTYSIKNEATDEWEKSNYSSEKGAIPKLLQQFLVTARCWFGRAKMSSIETTITNQVCPGWPIGSCLSNTSTSLPGSHRIRLRTITADRARTTSNMPELWKHQLNGRSDTKNTETSYIGRHGL